MPLHRADEPRNPRAALASLVACSWALACGGRASDGSTEPTQLRRGGAIVTWGTTGVMYKRHAGNLRLLDNILADFVSGIERNVSGINRERIEILYTRDCDPRVDSSFCGLADDLEDLAGFFQTVSRHGNLEFRAASNVDLSDYDIVIFDACESRPEIGDGGMRSYLEEGGHALILGDNFCFDDMQSTAQRANRLLRGMGVQFLGNDPSRREIAVVRTEVRTGLLQGVTSLDIDRTAPQSIEHSFEPVVDSVNGVLVASFRAE